MSVLIINGVRFQLEWRRFLVGIRVKMFHRFERNDSIMRKYARNFRFLYEMKSEIR